jgi:hypothetical protein
VFLTQAIAVLRSRFLMKRLHSFVGPNGGGCKNTRPRPTRIDFWFAAPSQMNLRNAAVGKFEQDIVLIIAPGESNSGQAEQRMRWA